LNRQPEVIIAGAGPAGSSAAAIFGEQGKSVLLLDKETFPREKTCGDGMTFKCLPALDRLGLRQAFLEKCQFSAKGYSLWFSNDTELTVRRSIGNSGSLVYILARSDFDDLLLRAALSHPTVKFQAETRVRSLIRDEDGAVKGVTAESGGRVTELFAPLVIDACGANSQLAVQAGAGNLDPTRCALAVRGYYDNVSGLSDTVEFYFPPSLQPGYLWVFPTSATSANVGLGTFMHLIEARRLDLHRMMREFLDVHPVARKKLQNAVLRGPLMGGKIPLAIDHESSRVRSGFIMTGDAGSFVDPITAEGISYAIWSGIFAGEIGSAALARGDCSAASLAPFDARWKEQFAKQFRRASIFDTAMSKEALSASVAKSFEQNEYVNGAAGDLTLQYELVFKMKALMKAL
jgi:geranylgeranyl reductase family protein